MSLSQLVEDMKDDASTWATVQREFERLRALTAERRRLQRMLEEARGKEVECLERVQLALRVIKQRQEGTSG